MRKVDVIIVGQGIAGTAVAFHLTKQGKSIHIFDKGHQHASSRVAAGLVNPLTGRKFVLSWRYPELREFAEKFYAELEAFLGIHIISETEIIRSVHKTSQWNDWQSRLSDPLYQPFVGKEAELSKIKQQFKPARWSVSIRNGMQVDLPALISAFRDHVWNLKALSEVKFHHDDLKIGEDKVQYRDIVAEKVIFCEGAGGSENPLFAGLPFNLSKGEVFLIKSDSIDLTATYKNHIFFIPLGNDKYWVGSYDRWKFDDELPTEQGAETLKEKIANVFKGPYRIIDHLSAIRPTVKDRRPFIGRHPDYPNLWICNGLGTKGTLLAPYFSLQLTNAIFNEGDIDKEVDIARYSG